MFIGWLVFFVCCTVLGVPIGFMIGLLVGQSADSWPMVGGAFLLVGLWLGLYAGRKITDRKNLENSELGLLDRLFMYVYQDSVHENEFIRNQVSTLVPLLLLIVSLIFLIVGSTDQDSTLLYQIALWVIAAIILISGIFSAGEYARKKYDRSKHGTNVFGRSDRHFLVAAIAFVVFYAAIGYVVFMQATEAQKNGFVSNHQWSLIQQKVEGIEKVLSERGIK